MANTAIWNPQSALTSITLSRADGASVDAGTTVSISEWTCQSEDPQGLSEPQVTSEVTSEIVSTAGLSVTLADLRVPSANLLVKGMSTEWGQKLYGRTLLSNIAGSLYKERDAIIKGLRDSVRQQVRGGAAGLQEEGRESRSGAPASV